MGPQVFIKRARIWPNLNKVILVLNLYLIFINYCLHFRKMKEHGTSWCFPLQSERWDNFMKLEEIIQFNVG